MLKSKKVFWFVGIIFVLLILFLPGYTKYQDLKDRIGELGLEIDNAKLENNTLEGEISRIQEDPVYQEEIIRQKLGVVRKGEVVYKIESE